MRRLLPLLLAGLAACQVDVEGAPCEPAYHSPGQSEDCPEGQGCGLDGRCRARAFACALCQPGEVRCDAAEPWRIVTCSAEADPVCGAWVTRDECEGGLVCGERTGAPACECPANAGAVFAADPEGARDPSAPPFPTGVESPAQCRYGRLGDALAAAGAHAAANPGEGAIARAHGKGTVTFGSAETGEAFPLAVAPGVTLTTAAKTPAPASWIVRADPASSAHVLTLHDGGRVEGLTLASVSAAGDVVRLACASRATARLDRVAVDGGGVAERGVAVEGPCDLEASDLTVTGAVGTGLYVDVELAVATEPTTGVRVLGGSIAGNGGHGAELHGGLLSLTGASDQRLLVADNQGHGVSARRRDSAPFAALALEIHRGDLRDNGEVGVHVKDLPAGSSVALTATDVHENRGQTPLSAYYQSRRAGGLVFWGEVVPLNFTGNRIWANAADQIGVLSGKDWKLSGSDCNGGANAFACPSAGSYLIYSAGAVQTAARGYWPVESWPPTSLLHQVEYQVGVDGICEMNSERLPTCPAIP